MILKIFSGIKINVSSDFPIINSIKNIYTPSIFFVRYNNLRKIVLFFVNQKK